MPTEFLNTADADYDARSDASLSPALAEKTGPSPMVWISPLSCMTEENIRITGPSWQPPPEAVTGVVWCAS